MPHKGAEASYLYDDPDIQQILVKRLSGRKRLPFKCVMMVDLSAHKQNLRDKKYKYTTKRLRDLHELGAEVWLCKGDSGNDIFHWKAMVFNGKTCFTGSANFTFSAKSQRNLMLKLTGPVASIILEGLMEAKQDSVAAF